MEWCINFILVSHCKPAARKLNHFYAGFSPRFTLGITLDFCDIAWSFAPAALELRQSQR
jgi:hypothetical protein